ncbi:hypothetical protein [Methylobacillus flagellatus]|nr:hypothetical protein [Methylobacillus flagellatus]
MRGSLEQSGAVKNETQQKLHFSLDQNNTVCKMRGSLEQGEAR